MAIFKKSVPAAATALFLAGQFTTAVPALAQNATAGGRPAGWFKVCAKQEDDEICNVQYQAIAGTGQVITSINLIERKGKNPARLFQVTVPSGRMIPPGITLKVDDKQGAKIPYAYCFPQSCVAEVKLDDNLVKVLKGGGKLTVMSVNFQAKENPIDVTLEGFTAAFDGPPLKQDELKTRQEELQKQLQEKAAETRKKLQDAQDAAKEGSAN
jgi:invasion protein IalB